MPLKPPRNSAPSAVVFFAYNIATFFNRHRLNSIVASLTLSPPHSVASLVRSGRHRDALRLLGVRTLPRFARRYRAGLPPPLSPPLAVPRSPRRLRLHPPENPTAPLVQLFLKSLHFSKAIRDPAKKNDGKKMEKRRKKDGKTMEKRRNLIEFQWNLIEFQWKIVENERKNDGKNQLKTD